MANIADFSDDPKYTIKNVAAETGIRPVTLRAWERRHEVLKPHRSDNRYRLYSDRDVAILRYLKSQVDNGVSISSAVSEFRSMTVQDIWPDAVPTAPTHRAGKSNIPTAVYSVKLTSALKKHDESTATELLREIQASFDMITLFSEVIIPTLVDIGEAWYTGQIQISTEHFASSFIRGKLLSLFQAYPSRRNAQRILVGCAPTEQHELGSLMIAVLLRSYGYNVEYLGPDIPVDDLVDYASYEKPQLIILSAVTPPAALEMKKMQEKLRKLRHIPVFAYGGRAFDIMPKLIEQVPGIYLGNSLETAIIKVRDLLPLSKQKLVPA